MTNNLKYSPRGMALTESMEGLRLQAYQDVASVWTIGYGHTGPELLPGMSISNVDATHLLASDISACVTLVNRSVTVPLNQNQFDALVDFVFNIGRAAFLQSTLLHNVNKGDFAAASHNFNSWVYAGGKVVPGLQRRRAAEAALFMEAV